MKCESCGNELTGGAIICRVCNHNNALRSDWRSQRVNTQYGPQYGQQHGQQHAFRRPGETQSNQSRATSPMTELPRIVPRKDADANLIHFPPAPNRQESRQTEAPRPARETGTVVEPPWRAELKERVRQIREKRNTGELAAPSMRPDRPSEVDLDRNPIVESALNRIRWSSHTPAITATIGGGAAAQRLIQTDAEPEPRPQPRSEARIDSRFASPKPNSASKPAVNRTADQSNRPPVSQVETRRPETRTLTPKTHREAGARPEPNPAPAPASKILTPRAKPHTGAEPKVETLDDRRRTETPPRPAIGRPSTARPLGGAPDKHVETQVIEIAQAPEPPPLPEAQPASLWVRTLAAACDFEIIATTYLPIFGAYAVLNTSLGGASFMIMLLLLSVVVFIYQMVMLRFAGRTFGMALLNLNLVNTDDETMPITRRQIRLRAVAATITFICLPLHLFTRFNLSQRSLPDWISGTTVTEQ